MEKLTDRELEQELLILERQLRIFQNLRSGGADPEHPTVQKIRDRNAQLEARYQKCTKSTHDLARRLKQQGLGPMGGSVTKDEEKLKLKVEKLFRLFRKRQENAEKQAQNPPAPALNLPKTDFKKYKAVRSGQIFQESEASESRPWALPRKILDLQKVSVPEKDAENRATIQFIKGFEELDDEFVAEEIERANAKKRKTIENLAKKSLKLRNSSSSRYVEPAGPVGTPRGSKLASVSLNQEWEGYTSHEVPSVSGRSLKKSVKALPQSKGSIVSSRVSKKSSITQKNSLGERQPAPQPPASESQTTKNRPKASTSPNLRGALAGLPNHSKTERTQPPLTPKSEAVQQEEGPVEKERLEKFREKLWSAIQTQTKEKVEFLLKNYSNNPIIMELLGISSPAPLPQTPKKTAQSAKLSSTVTSKPHPPQTSHCSSFYCHHGAEATCPKQFGGARDPRNPQIPTSKINDPEEIIKKYLEKNQKNPPSQHKIQSLIEFNKKTHDISPKKQVFEAKTASSLLEELARARPSPGPATPPPEAKKQTLAQKRVTIANSKRLSEPNQPGQILGIQNEGGLGVRRSSNQAVAPLSMKKKMSDQLPHPSQALIGFQEQPKTSKGRPSYLPRVTQVGLSSSFDPQSSDGVTASEQTVNVDPKDSIEFPAFDFTTFSQFAPPNPTILSNAAQDAPALPPGETPLSQHQQIVGESTDSQYQDDSRFFLNEVGLRIPYHVTYHPTVSETPRESLVLNPRRTSVPTLLHMDLSNQGDVADYMDDLY